MSLATQHFDLNLRPGKHPPHIKSTQYDAGADGWAFKAHLKFDDEPFTVPSGYTAQVEGSIDAQDIAFRVNATISNDTVSFSLTTGNIPVRGKWWCKILLKKGSSVLQTSGFVLDADPAGAQPDDVTRTSGFEDEVKQDVYDYLDDNQLASIAFLPQGLVPSGTDLDTVVESGHYLLGSAPTFQYDHNPLPSSHIGVLLVYKESASYGVQVIHDMIAGNKLTYRRARTSADFSGSAWTLITGERTMLVQPENTYTTCNSVNESCILFNTMTNGVMTYPDFPFDGAGWLVTIKSFSALSTKLQIAIKYTGFSVKFRTCNVSGTWGAWSTGGGGEVLSSCDLDTVIGGGNSFYLLSSANAYTHTPEGKTVGFLLKMTAGDWTYQTFFSLTDHVVWSRTYGPSFVDGQTVMVWRNEWARLGGTGAGGGNHYENTYHITCNPTITTETVNYIAAPGDTTDMTGAIQTMLNTTRVCRLGPGDFYVTGIEIPNNGTLIGSGTKTRLILAPSVIEGYAVKLKTHSCVQDLEIIGQTTDYTPVAETGKRDGIIFEGTADAASGAVTHYRSTVQNVVISDFHGSGVRCENTGGLVESCCHFTDIHIYRCDVGVNVAYYSEYHRWTAVSVTRSYYGAIVNGGNNNFANCDFSGNTIGLLIDDSAGTSRNNSHGTFSACSFNHSGANSGTAIRILGADNGEVFTGCQIFYGAIEIDSSTGIRFVGANIGRAVPIRVTNSKVVSFSDCTMFSASEDPITQSGNTAFIVDKCYYYSGAEVSV